MKLMMYPLKAIIVVSLLTFFASNLAMSAHGQTKQLDNVRLLNRLNPAATQPAKIATPPASLATGAAALASPSAEEIKKIEKIKKEDVTKPEEPEEKEEVFALFAQRPVFKPGLTNFMAYAVQYAVGAGVPANTIMLILLLPLLATLVAFLRHVVGLPSLGMLVSISLSITLLATKITAGIILLLTILLASTFARIILKKIRIMQLPKMALSVFIVSLFVFSALTLSASIGILQVKQLSIFPVLLLILLSERIVALQLERSIKETILITAVTLAIGLIGFLLLSSETLRSLVLLYPEMVLFLIPLNIAIGRYFGLRITEYFRFSPILGK